VTQAKAPKDPAHPRGRPCSRRPCHHDRKVEQERNRTKAAQAKGRAPAGKGKTAANNPDRVKLRLSPLMSAVIRGEEDLSTWTEEEILRGQKAGANGKFNNAHLPSVVPTELLNEYRLRIMGNARAIMQRSFLPAVALMGELVADEDADPKLRFEAARYVIDRIAGRPPQHVTVDTGDEIDEYKAHLVQAAARAIEASKAQGTNVIQFPEAEVVEPDAGT
jgi:hypothetical protein